MLQIEHLSITHLQDLRPILADFSLVLQDGEKAALIGEEGNGKSTLLKLLFDEALVENYVEWSGEIRRNQCRLGYLPQELPAACRRLSVSAFWAQGPGLGRGEELTRTLGLAPGLLESGRPMESLSGGERVKVQLARLLAEEPDVLLLDEPSNDLDLETLEWLEAFLCRCPRSVLYVSHDETLIQRTADVLIHLELLRRKSVPRATVVRMPYDEYVKARQAKFRHQTQVARQEQAEFQRKLERYRQIRNKVDRQQATITRQDPHGGRLLKKKMHAVQAMGRRFEREKAQLTQLPELEEAIFLRFPEEIQMPRGKTVLSYRQEALEAGDRVLARNLSLEVVGPEKIGFIGQNGAGKSTLLRSIFRSLQGRTDLRAAYMPQDYKELLDPAATPAAFLNRSGSREEETRVRSFLGSARYTTQEMTHAIAELSGGQKAKLLLLDMILQRANVLVLDEPTRNFSPLSGPVVRSLLSAYGGAILSVSHDRLYLEQVCQRVYALTETGLVRVWDRERPEP